MQTTIRTRVKAEEVYPFLLEMSQEYSRIKRKLFVAITQGQKNRTELKREFCAQHQITARQFNSLWSEVNALISSAQELKKMKIQSLEERIKKISERIEQAKDAFKIHQWKRKKERHHLKLAKCKENLKKAPSICFGSRKLFQKQFHLRENGYADHEGWKQDWQRARNNQFFLIGSKDESFGNQSCQLLAGQLKLRLTHSMAAKYGRTHVSIPCEFTYAQETLQEALKNHQAISYRFVYERDRWYVLLSTERPEVKIRSNPNRGALGIDLNPKCIAIAHTSAEGNLLRSWQVPICIEGRRQDQIKSTLGEEVSKIVQYAEAHSIVIVAEQLDFSKKKAELRSRKLNRMLSHFAYSQFSAFLESRCTKAGIELKKVNPAYTSVIGFFKFSLGYGLSSHCAAAMAIARRGICKSKTQVLSERLRMKAKSALDLPARIGKLRTEARHVWSDWRRLSLMAKKVSQRAPLGRQRPERTSGEFISSVFTQIELQMTRKAQKTEAAMKKSPPHGKSQEDRLPGVIDCLA